MDMREALLALRQRWALIVVITLLGVAGGVIALFAMPVQYNSESSIYLSATAASNSGDVSGGNSAAQSIAASMAQVATTPMVLDEAKRDLRLSQSTAQLASYVTVTVPTNTVVMQISVTAPSPVLAAQLANTIAAEIGVQVARLNPNVGNASSVLRTYTLSEAQPNVIPVGPHLQNVLGTGLLVGFAIGVVLVLVMRLLTRRVLSAADVATVSTLPVVGTVPEMRTAGLSVAMQTEGEESTFVEAMRELRANLRFLAPELQSRVIMVTSANADDGKSTIAANLAVSLALFGQRTLLIDADMRRPSLHDYWSLETAAGLSTALIGEHGLLAGVVQVGPPNLYLLPAGPIAPNPGELCGSRRFRELIDEARTGWDLIVVDTPPVQLVADALVLAPHVDGVVVAVRAQKTFLSELESALDKLHANHAPIFGAVLSRVNSREFGKYGYRYKSHAASSENARTSTSAAPLPN